MKSSLPPDQLAKLMQQMDQPSPAPQPAQRTLPSEGFRLVAIDLSILDWFWVFLKATVGLWLVALLLAAPGYIMALLFLAMIHGAR